MSYIATEIWDKARLVIKKELTDLSYSTWIEPLMAVSCEGDSFILQAPNDFAKTQAENYISLITNAILTIVPVRFNIKIIVNNDILPQVTFKPDFNYEGSALNPAYTFDNFIVGSSNSHAHAACVSVAQKQHIFNPLFLYGGSGLGKTHLLHAIGNYVRINYPNSKIIYVACEQFVNEFIKTIRENSYDKFRAKYRSCDMLLIDDIQFIESKEQMQIEFFSTFNALTEVGSQIIMTCDKPPYSLESLEERLRTRFASGLIVDINIPDYETRRAILENLAIHKHINMPIEIIDYIALNFETSIRELEGAFTTVVSYSYISGKLDMEVAQNALSNLINPVKTCKMTPETIIPIVGRYFNFSVEDIKSKNKNKDLAVARQVTMYLLTKYANLTYKQIGSVLGGKHHSTIMYGYNKINDELKAGNEELISTINEITRRIKGVN